MTKHRLANTALFALALIAWLFVMDSDYEAETALDAELQQEWAELESSNNQCRIAHGIEYQIEVDDNGKTFCANQNGRRFPWI